MIGLFAIGTSCFALVWVMGRSRVPAPPARIKPFIRGENSTAPPADVRPTGAFRRFSVVGSGPMTDRYEHADGCDLCEAARITPWYYEDDVCWIAECEIWATRMVVWRGPRTAPPA